MDASFNQQVRIAFAVEGQAALDRLHDQLAKIADDMTAEAQLVGLGKQSFDQYLASTAALAAEHAKLSDALEAVGQSASSATTKINAASGAAGGATNNVGALSRGFLELSRGIEDVATGGIAGGLNNLPGMFANFGQAAGMTLPQINALSTAVTLLGTGALVLYKNWDTVTKLFQGGIPRPILDSTDELERKLKDAKKTTEDLGKESSLTVSQMLEYRKASESVKVLTEELKKAKELQDLLDAKSKGQRERGSGFKEAFAESGGGSALSELRQALNTQEDAKGMVYDPVSNSMMTAEKAAESMVTAAGAGDEQAIGAILKALGGAFGDKSGFAANIRKFSPAGQAMAKQGEAHEKAIAGMFGEWEKEDKAAENFKVDALNAQGDEATKDWKAKEAAAKKEAADTLGQFKGTMGDDLAMALLKRMMRGQSADIAGAALAPQARAAMVAAGADPTAAFDASYQLLESVKGGVNAQLADRGGVGPRSIQSLMAEISQKRATRDVAADNREAKLGKAADMASQTTQFREAGYSEQVSAKLAADTLNLMGKGLSEQEAQGAAIGQLFREVQALRQRMGQVHQQNQRGRQRQPTLLNPFPPGIR